MKTLTLFIFSISLLFSVPALAQGDSIRTEPSPPKQGCRKIDVRCQCVNPEKDFVVKGQKLGKTNPGERGECQSSKDINASAEKMPVAYCLGSQSVKDVRKGQSKCTATWTCVEPCTIKPVP